MTLRRRFGIFGYVAAAAIVADLIVTVTEADFDTRLRFTGWWFLLPTLGAATLLIQPAWGSAVAGLAAGGVISQSTGA